MESDLSNAIASFLTPSGMVGTFARETPPTGWLKANGAAISRSAYPELFEAIGIIFGVGDGSTTFTLPDLRGEFIRGFDDGRGVDAGRIFGSNQAQSYQSHYHAQSRGIVTSKGGSAYALFQMIRTSDWDGSTANDIPMNSGGTETRPRNIALLACIKY